MIRQYFKWVNLGGNRIILLKDLSLTVNEGEFILIMRLVRIQKNYLTKCDRYVR